VLLTVADAIGGPAAATGRGAGVAGVSGAEGARFVRAASASRRPVVPVTDPESRRREVVPTLGTGKDAALVGIAVPRDLAALARAAL